MNETIITSIETALKHAKSGATPSCITSLTNAIRLIVQEQESPALDIERDGGGYRVRVWPFYGMQFRWASNALDYAVELIEMGYEPSSTCIKEAMIDKLRFWITEEQPAFNEWLDQLAERNW